MLLAVADCWATAAGITLADLLRYQFNVQKSITSHLLLIVSIACALQVVIGVISPLYRSSWRIGSFEEMVCLAPTVLGVAGLVTAFSFVHAQHVVPASATIGGGALALVGAAGYRVVWRLDGERSRPVASVAERTIIFGAGDTGAHLVDSLLLDAASGYLPVAVLDDEPAKRGLRLRRLRVVGNRFDLASIAERFGADSVVIAIRSADSRLVRDITELANEAGIATKVLPSLREMLASDFDSTAIRTVTPEDLLGRRVIDTQVDLIAGYLTGKRVLVTGAGGSIGSELCRQIARFEPASLVMLDRDESALHQVQLSIEGRALLDSRELVLCDIRDGAAVEQVFAEHCPEVVFHAAALKHLPLLEMWPTEALKTNVRGTQNVIDAAGSFGVECFVNISTDKAVNPSSALGYSKRIGERLTAAASGIYEGTYLSVRFGNVLGSRGSVLTTFRAQLESGGPLTVTHPDVTRYFMTVEEAVELVIQAGSVGSDGDVLVLDMGEPVRIADVATQMAQAAGRVPTIVYTGLRPGEKLREELFGPDEVGVAWSHRLIAHVKVPPLPSSAVDLLELESTPENARERLADFCEGTFEGSDAMVIDLRAPSPAAQQLELPNGFGEAIGY